MNKSPSTTAPPTPPRQRTIARADYERMYKLLESGTHRDTVCEIYSIKWHTLYCRIQKDRPQLLDRLKKLPTGKQIAADPAVPLMQVIEARGRRTRDSLSKVVEHDVDVLAERVDRQRKSREADPEYNMGTVALDQAADLKAMAQIAAMIPGMGLESGGSGVNVQVGVQLNHAEVMRVDGSKLLADPASLPPECFIDVEAGVIE